MKEQMKKLLGFWPLSSDMPPKSSQTFTMPIPLSLGHCHLLSLDVFTHSDSSERNLFFCMVPRKNLFLFLKFYVLLLFLFSNIWLLWLLSVWLHLHLFHSLHQPFQCCCHPLLGLPPLHHLQDKSFNESSHVNVEWVVPFNSEVNLQFLGGSNHPCVLQPQPFQQPQSICWLCEALFNVGGPKPPSTHQILLF